MGEIGIHTGRNGKQNCRFWWLLLSATNALKGVDDRLRSISQSKETLLPAAGRQKKEDWTQAPVLRMADHWRRLMPRLRSASCADSRALIKQE